LGICCRFRPDDPVGRGFAIAARVRASKLSGPIHPPAGGPFAVLQFASPLTTNNSPLTFGNPSLASGAIKFRYCKANSQSQVSRAHSPLKTHHSLFFISPFLPPGYDLHQAISTFYHQLIKIGFSFLPRDLHFFPPVAIKSKNCI